MRTVQIGVQVSCMSLHDARSRRQSPTRAAKRPYHELHGACDHSCTHAQHSRTRCADPTRLHNGTTGSVMRASEHITDACLAGTGNRRRTGELATIFGPNVYSSGSTSIACDWVTTHRFHDIRRWPDHSPNWDWVSIDIRSANIPGYFVNSALLDTEKALCYVLPVLGDSVPPDAGLIGWAKASNGVPFGWERVAQCESESGMCTWLSASMQRTGSIRRQRRPRLGTRSDNTPRSPFSNQWNGWDVSPGP